MKLLGSLTELLQIKWRKDGFEITSRPNQSTTYTANRDIQLPPGDSAHVLMSEAGTQTVTNKSIDADTNTITNIDNNDIKASAGIDATKIANGTVDNTEFQRLNSAGTAGAGNLVTTDGTQTLTAKSIDGDDNTVTDLAITALKTVLADANKVLRRDASGIPQSGNTIPNTSALVTTDASQTLTAKAIDGDDNTLTDIGISSLKTVLADANKILRRDASGAVISGNALPNSSQIVTLDSSDTLTNKTLTSPTINTPTVTSPTVTGGATVRGDLLLQNTSGSQPTLQLSEDPDNGTNKITVKAPATLAADWDLTLPTTDGDSGQVLTTDGAGVTSWVTPGATTGSLVNTVINGGMHFWQRNTGSTANVGDSQFGADRFRIRKANTTGVFTVSRESSILPTAAQASANIPYALKLACTTADASVAATDTVSIQHAIEGFDFGTFLTGKTCRLQFWVYSNKTGTYCVAFRNSAQDRVYVSEYTISSANTWELKSIDVTFNSSGTWLFDKNVGLVIDWTLMAGSTAQTTANSWNTVTAANNVKATSNQVNFSDSTSNVFYLTGVQLVPGNFGASTLPFFTNGTSIQRELEACQRYHEKSYDIEVNPGTNTGSGEWTEIAPKSSSFGATIQFKVQKRTTPTITAYTIFGTSGAVTDNDNGNADVTTSARIKEGNFQWSFSRTSGRQYFFYWVAEAELLATL